MIFINSFWIIVVEIYDKRFIFKMKIIDKLIKIKP